MANFIVFGKAEYREAAIAKTASPHHGSREGGKEGGEGHEGQEGVAPPV